VYDELSEEQEDETPHVPITTSSEDEGATPPTQREPDVKSLVELSAERSNVIVAARVKHASATKTKKTCAKRCIFANLSQNIHCDGWGTVTRRYSGGVHAVVGHIGIPTAKNMS
jgi:ribosomal protein S27E